MMSCCRIAQTGLCALALFAVVTAAPAPDQGTVAATPRPAYRVIALAEPGQTIHQPFADAAVQWLRDTAGREGFTVDYIRTTDPIDEAYLAAHDLFIQVNYPPYRWTPVAEAAFKKAMEQGTIGWIGFHHASLLGKFDGFEMSPFFHQFMGRIVFKSYIRDFATGVVHVEDAAHPVFNGLAGGLHDRERRVVHLRSLAPAGCPRAGHRGRKQLRPAAHGEDGRSPGDLDQPELQGQERLFSVRAQGRAARQPHLHAALPQRDPVGLRRVRARSRATRKQCFQRNQFVAFEPS